VWSDLRTDGIVSRLKEEFGVDYFRESTGLPISTYFSAVKVKWMLENVKGVYQAIEEERFDRNSLFLDLLT